MTVVIALASLVLAYLVSPVPQRDERIGWAGVECRGEGCFGRPEGFDYYHEAPLSSMAPNRTRGGQALHGSGASTGGSVGCMWPTKPTAVSR